MPQLGRNSGLDVAITKSGGVPAALGKRAQYVESSWGPPIAGPRSARTIGWARAPAMTQERSAASCRRRISSGANDGARPGGNGMSTSGASNGTSSAKSMPMRRDVSVEVREAFLGRRVHAETQAAPFGDRVQRRLLQELRGAPTRPRCAAFGEPRQELLDEPGLRGPALRRSARTDLARPRALPAGRVGEGQLLLRPTKGVRDLGRFDVQRRSRERRGKPGPARKRP